MRSLNSENKECDFTKSYGTLLEVMSSTLSCWIASVTKLIGIFEVKKGNIITCLHEKMFTIKLFSVA